MRLDVPECKKCCCCVPLRYGLLTWGYLKLLVGVSLLILVLVASFTMEYTTPGMVVFWAVIICVCLADLSLNIVFIVGAHMKNYKLLRIFYYATMVGVVAYFLFCMAFFVLQLVTIHQMELSVTSDLAWRMVKEFAEVAVNIALDVYLLLLTRSEILKLQRNCRIQFTNNAADAECQFNLQGETPGLSVHGIAHDTIVSKNVEII